MKSMSDALAALDAALRVTGASTTDPERRRAASRLAELIRSDDADLSRFASRHLPGHALDDEALRNLRDVAFAFARLVALQGKVPEAATLFAELGSTLQGRIGPLEEEARRPPASASPPVRAYVDDDGTLPMPAPLVLEDGPNLDASGRAFPVPSFALPFAPGAPITMGGGDVDRAEDPFAERVTLPPDSKVRANPATPFADGPANVPPRVPAPVAPQRPSGTLADDVGTRRNGTAPDAFRAAPAAALPFKPTHATERLPAHLAAITLEMYAVLSAMLIAFPARKAEVFARYGVLDDADHALLEGHWRSRLESDPAALAHWRSVRDQALAHYRRSNG